MLANSQRTVSSLISWSISSQSLGARLAVGRGDYSVRRGRVDGDWGLEARAAGERSIVGGGGER